MQTRFEIVTLVMLKLEIYLEILFGKILYIPYSHFWNIPALMRKRSVVLSRGPGYSQEGELADNEKIQYRDIF